MCQLSFFSAGYTPMLDGLSDVFYTAITTLENFIRAFESEVTASGVKLDLDHLQDLQRRRDELQREKTNWLHQIAEQASKIPGLGHLFDDYSVLQAEKKVQLMEDFRDFIHRHDSDFSELNGLIEQVLLGLEELGKQRSFNGDKQGYSPINFMNLNWSKNLDSYHKKHGEEVKKVQKKDMENFKNMAKSAGDIVGAEIFMSNAEIVGMKGILHESAQSYYGTSNGLKNNKSTSVKKGSTGVKSANVEIKYTPYGEHISVGKYGKKALLPDINYETLEGYRYTTDKNSKITKVSVDNLEIGTAKRNPYAQGKAGGVDRLPIDDGGHLIASQFKGSSDIDNLVAQSKFINRAGGEWYNMEQEWARALKSNLTVNNIKIEIEYPFGSERPAVFKVSYQIEGKLPVTRRIINE
ncbi:DNA/RNA non-specific endonuclease [Carnobacterium maltaromaticum]|uniref:DNA/RNA non-specific endonuclease n=1 Tax=Carnobacterium maltaromaticum TaxID=2751 RepID=UPI0039BDDBDC